MDSNRILDIHSAITRAALDYLEAAGRDEEQAKINVFQDAANGQCSLCSLIGAKVAELIDTETRAILCHTEAMRKAKRGEQQDDRRR